MHSMADRRPRAGAIRAHPDPVTTMLRLALAPAVSLGVARFAYALVLPDMRADLGWSYAEAGAMNTSNAAGYLIGALVSARVVARLREYPAMMAGVVLCLAALALSAVARDAWLLNLARGLAGFGGGVAFVAAGVLATAVAASAPRMAGLLIGIFYAGAGLGILLSGLVAPLLLEGWGPGSWPRIWMVLTAVSVLLTVILASVRVGHLETLSAASDAPPAGSMRWLLAAYLVFGAGYIAFMTFMIARVQDAGGSAILQATFWALIGVAAMASPWLWSRVLDRVRHGHAFALLTAITTAGAALPLVSGTPAAMLASAVVFGGAFFAVVASTTVFVRRNYPRAGWSAAIAMLTIAFGIGQTIGPVAVGVIADAGPGIAAGLWISIGLLASAALVACLQRDGAATRG